MRCHYMSDLHLERQDFSCPLPRGDVLIIAGDLCHAQCLDPRRTDKYSIDQCSRVHRFIDRATAHFARILLVVGNHEHYDGVFEDTVNQLRHHLPQVTVLDNEYVELDGIRIFGSTLWSDFEGRSQESMNGVRRRMGEFFFVKRRRCNADGEPILVKFQPEDALTAFDLSWSALRTCTATDDGKPTVVVTHHAPSLQGLNARFTGSALNGAYASDLDGVIAGLARVPVWVHGHTHVRRRYQIGDTTVLANCRGIGDHGEAGPRFSAHAYFDV